MIGDFYENIRAWANLVPGGGILFSRFMAQSGIYMGAYPTGKGAWMSSPNQFGTSGAELIQICREADLKYLLMATHYGGETAARACIKAGIQVWAYDWVDPSNADEFLSRSAAWVTATGAAGLVVDAEGPYQNKPHEAAALKEKVWRATNYGLNAGVGFTSMGAAYMHPSFPWAQFGGLGFGMPQTYQYSANTPGAPAKALSSWRERGWRYLIPAVPTWREDDKPLTPESLVKLCDDLKANGALGVSAWSLIHKNRAPDLWDAFAKYKW